MSTVASAVPDRVWRVALNLVTEPGDARIARTVADYGPEQAMRFWCAIHSTPSVQHVPQAYAVQAQHVIDAAARDGIRVIIPGDTEWPAQLSDMDAALAAPGHRTSAAPLCLWVSGKPDLSALLTHSVTIAGARACTPYGRHTASQLAFGLAQHGWTVAAGGAYGIDDTAHRGAMLAGAGVTIAVLASGLEQPHPISQQSLFDSITGGGALASPWPPTAAPKRDRFVYRNQLLAALTAGTVIVEAARRSGALTVARAAHTLGRVVMAVPGPVGNSTSAGVHDLARQIPAIRLVTDTNDVLTDLTTT